MLKLHENKTKDCIIGWKAQYETDTSIDRYMDYVQALRRVNGRKYEWLVSIKEEYMDVRQPDMRYLRWGVQRSGLNGLKKAHWMENQHQTRINIQIYGTNAG